MLRIGGLGVLVVAVVGLLSLIIRAAVAARRRARLRRQMGDGAPVIEDRKMVTVVGVVRALAPLTAPLAGTPCVAYRTVVKCRKPVASESTTHPVHVNERLAPFELIADGGAVVLVEGPAFELVSNASAPIIPRPLQRQLALMKAYGLDDDSIATTSFEEVRIAHGDRISVLGMAVVETDPSGAADYRNIPTVTRLIPGDRERLLIDRLRR